MIQGVSGASSTSALYQEQVQQNPAADKHKSAQKIERRDSVELSQTALQALESTQKQSQNQDQKQNQTQNQS